MKEFNVPNLNQNNEKELSAEEQFKKMEAELGGEIISEIKQKKLDEIFGAEESRKDNPLKSAVELAMEKVAGDNEDKKRMDDLREEINKLEIEAGKKYAGGGYIDKTKASFDQQIAEKEAELKKLENGIDGGKALTEEKAKTLAEKNDEEMGKYFAENESTLVKDYDKDNVEIREKMAVEEIDKEKPAEERCSEREKNLLRLEKELETSRMDLAKMDLKKGKLWQRVAGFFKKDAGQFGEDKDVAFMRERYEESLRVYKASFLEEAKRGNITEEEIGYIFEYFDKDEKAKLYDSRTEARLENVKGTKFEFIRENCAKAVNWYIAMKPPKKKLALGIALGGGAAVAAIAAGFGVAGAGTAMGILAAANMVRRVLGGAAVGVAADAYLDKKGEERRSRESDLKVRSLKYMLDKNDFAEGMEDVPLSSEEKVKILEDWLDGNEKKVSADLQKRKLGSLFKKSSAALAGYLVGSGMLFRFVSEQTGAGEYVGEKFSELKQTDFGKWVMEKIGWGGAGATVKPETGGAGVKPKVADVLPVTEAPVEAPVAPVEAPSEVPTEAPVEAPTEAPAEIPTETPAEAPIEKSEPWSQEVIEQQNEPLPTHEFTRREIVDELYKKFYLFSGTYDNLAHRDMNEIFAMTSGQMYSNAPWEGYDYNEISGLQKSLHDFYDGLSPEQQAEAGTMDLDDFIKKHSVDYLGDGEAGPSAVESVPGNAAEALNEVPNAATSAPESGVDSAAAAENAQGAVAENGNSETAQSGRKSFPPHDREFDSPNAVKEVIDETNAPPHEQPTPNAEKIIPYPEEVVKQGNSFLSRGYSEGSLRKIMDASPLDGKSVSGEKVLAVTGADGRTYEVVNNAESKAAAEYALRGKEFMANWRQGVAGGDDINKWNEMKNQPIERILQDEGLTREQRRYLLRAKRFETARGGLLNSAIKRAFYHAIRGRHW